MSDEKVETDGEPVERPQSRRALLGAAGAAVGAVAAGRLLGPDAASAADGGNLVLGQANTATSRTSLATSGLITNDGALSVTAASADYGVYGSGASYGVVGTGPGGVLGLGSVGGVFSGSVVAINLNPQSAVGAPTGQAFKGDLAIDSTGVLWMCVAAGPGNGTPGTWIKVSHGGVRPLPSPVRVFTGALNRGSPVVVPVAGVVQGIPAIAVGIAGNLTVHHTTGGGFATIYPTGPTIPDTSNINWNGTSDGAIANSVTVGLGTGGAVSIYADATVALGAHATEVILDVSAYVL